MFSKPSEEKFGSVSGKFDFINDKRTNIDNVVNTVDITSKQFYDDAKDIFKKLKLLRGKRIESEKENKKLNEESEEYKNKLEKKLNLLSKQEEDGDKGKENIRSSSQPKVASASSSKFKF